jgi:hypothetical protein
MASSVVEFQENLVQFDNLLNALNYLIEEVKTRQAEAFSSVNILEKVKEEMYSDRFLESILDFIRHDYGRGLYQEVAFLVMEKIDNDIEAFLNARVDERLRELGVIPAAAGG